MIIVNAFGNECMNTEVFVPSYKLVHACLLHMTIATRPSPCFHQQVKRSNQPKKKKTKQDTFFLQFFAEEEGE